MDSNKIEVKPLFELTPVEMMTTVMTLIDAKPFSHDDCTNLRKLQAQINQAVYDLCDTCRPADPTGPAVCNPGQFLPKAVE
tara:strand:- start:808 stop:1050 length:243 start_codon:yes stop_codon:yes gene_type:complete